MTFPRPSLANFVATLLAHGNTPETLNIETLAKHNTWTSADAILAEFRIQQNGSRKLPEEVASQATPEPTSEEVTDE